LRSGGFGTTPTRQSSFKVYKDLKILHRTTQRRLFDDPFRSVRIMWGDILDVLDDLDGLDPLADHEAVKDVKILKNVKICQSRASA
jgi:hypothetical protein